MTLPTHLSHHRLQPLTSVDQYVPPDLPTVTHLDRGWLVELVVETGDFVVTPFSEFESRCWHNAERETANNPFSPRIPIRFFPAKGGAFDRSEAYALADALQGIVCPLQTPWPPGTAEDIRSIDTANMMRFWQFIQDRQTELPADGA